MAINRLLAVFFDSLVIFEMKPIDWLPDSSIAMKSPPDVFFFILVIAVKDNFFEFLTIWKEAFSGEETYILFLKDLDNLVHLFTILEVEKEAPFGVDKICRVSFRNKSKRQPIFHSDTVAE